MQTVVVQRCVLSCHVILLAFFLSFLQIHTPVYPPGAYTPVFPSTHIAICHILQSVQSASQPTNHPSVCPHTFPLTFSFRHRPYHLSNHTQTSTHPSPTQPSVHPPQNSTTRHMHSSSIYLSTQLRSHPLTHPPTQPSLHPPQNSTTQPYNYSLSRHALIQPSTCPPS